MWTASGRWIGYGSHNPWTSESPDVTPVDFLWEMCFNNIYVCPITLTEPETICKAIVLFEQSPWKCKNFPVSLECYFNFQWNSYWASE